MQRFYRTMKADSDGKPLVGRSARTLGVRVGGPHADVRPDEIGRVHPGAGGMSITVDDPSRMPVARRPKWLQDGQSEDPLFVLLPRDLAPQLTVRVDSGSHGLVEPVGARALEDYERDLAGTRASWFAST